MSWVNKYWDILDQIYWDPKYIGMKSLSRQRWIVDGERISIPAEFTNANGPIYTRARKATAHRDHLLGQEEILNHIFDLTFSIAPDELIYRSFLEPLGICDNGPFISLGREVASRYGWGEMENVTQQDGLFVSERSAVAVELKINASSSPEQLAKYVALLAWEELTNGRRKDLGLLFVIPESKIPKHWAQLGLESPGLDESWLDRKRWARPLPKRIANLYTEERKIINSVLNRIRINMISWKQLLICIKSMRNDFKNNTPGNQTFHRLVSGFEEHLEKHRGLETK